MSKTKVTFVASTLGVGGAETVMYNLLTGMSTDRFEFEMLFLREPGATGARLIDAGIPVSHGLQHKRFDPTILLRLIPRLRAFSPDVLFCLDHHNAVFWGGISSILASVPRRVIACHSTGRMGGRPTFRRSDHLIIGRSDVVVALSESHAHYLENTEGVDAKKLVIVENGIDTSLYESVGAKAVEERRRELGVSSEDKVIIMVAAMRPEKAHDAVLRATSELAKTDAAIRMLFVGDGAERPSLERMTDELDLRGHVQFLGRRTDVHELLQLAHALVLPSHPAVETQPMAALEAMAAGVPVVASTVGSVPDMIEDGVNGRLIPPADAAALAAALRDIFGNAEQTARLIHNARDTVRTRYSTRHMVQKFEALFERLAATTQA